MNIKSKDTMTNENIKIEEDFLKQLWIKVRDGFRRYSKRGKLR